MYHPGNSEIAGVLVIDRENRRNTPDIVRAIPADALRSTPLPHILSRLGYHPSNLGRSREFDSPPSVGEIASVLADMSQVGGDYSSTDKNCYWYANAVFDHCWLAYGGRITIGPYYDDLGRFRGVAPRNVIRQRIITGVRYTSLTVLGAGLGGASIPLAAGGIAIIAASFLIKRSKMFQAAPLLS
ncbi:hypothetical protein K503DRAFT_33506 [Rhizopogon vinicolor AM-OR11-026]|uniref:Uncharacterized protein n=1 Tax=Rhizopogon vinicolor AM-OR11-026 TaxID=1314800 RepID=A0A1B7N5C6_9AGAM|nr:hypothetical protein K503DRAFT_33506 [Rhizopogon vinicolor AM-OR11-026]